MRGAGALREKVAFDVKVQSPDGSGGRTSSWSEVFIDAAEFRYERGVEAVEAGAVTGSASFKIRVRSSEATRSLNTGYRMRDVRRNIAFNIRECDAITDRDWVWLVAETGVAI